MSLLAMPLLALASAGTTRMYGLSMSSALVSIDLETGSMKELTAEHPAELESQELSAIDAKRARYYSAGVNSTTNKVNLCVWSLSAGHKERQVELPFESSVFVGVGEALNVDPTDGTIIVMGHDPSRGGHHCLYTLDPDTFKPKFVADVGGDMHVDMLGGSTTYDHDAKVAYVATAYNDSTPVPALKFNAVHLTTGKVEVLDKGLLMAGLAYDSKTKRVYGTAVASAAAQTSTPEAAAALWGGATAARWRRPGKACPTRTGDVSLTRSLAYFDAATRAGLVTVAELPLTMSIGDVHTIDPTARVHYTLLAGKLNASAYEPTDYCSKHGNPCAAGASCCCEPPCTDAQKYGFCYAVDDCSKIPSGDPLAVPDFLIGVGLDSGEVVTKVPVCSMEPGPKTNPNVCPWSVEAAAA